MVVPGGFRFGRAWGRAPAAARPTGDGAPSVPERPARAGVRDNVERREGRNNGRTRDGHSRISTGRISLSLRRGQTRGRGDRAFGPAAEPEPWVGRPSGASPWSSPVVGGL